MSRLVIVVEKPSDWGSYYPSDNVVSATDYLKDTAPASTDERVQVINLCRSYKYLGVGYYVSLLAEARGHRVIPSVRTINDLRRRSLYGLDIGDLNQRLSKFLPGGGTDTTSFGLLVYFGQTGHAPLAEIARQVFEAFPCPILKIEFERQRIWQIAAIKPTGLQTLDDAQEDAFASALDAFSRKIWRKPRARKSFRYDIAMLHDPNEALPPSNKRALRHFVEAGKALGIEVDPITRNDYSRLAEYDGLFIRETTSLDNHTYRFAHRAEREGMVVIDDPVSILRCTNKIYLNDLLRARKLPTPRTEVVFRDNDAQLAALGESLGYPLVLKIPDGSFSRGVVKVGNEEALRAAAAELFGQSALLIAQEFMYTEYDWRIGVLNGQALYACQYFMSRGHWQIYDHASGSTKGMPRSGGFKTLPVRDAPSDVVKLALKATAAIGDGLYGVDIKADGKRVAIIEVNDNPSIDAGVEDAYLGEDLYRRIMGEFLRRLERKRLGISD
ncbi:RimK family protein [Xanthomonadaceae bacterium XH05]|nr:RimK family protein [Xanthomonadaceae bacterium XH05]